MRIDTFNSCLTPNTHMATWERPNDQKQKKKKKHVSQQLASNIKYLFTKSPMNSPFLYFTVRFTWMIDKSANVSHTISINHSTTVKIQTIMMSFLRIVFRHSSFKFLFTHNLSKILQNKLTYKIIYFLKPLCNHTEML